MDLSYSNLVPQVWKVDINAIQLSGKVCEKVYAFLSVISQYTVTLKSIVNQDEIKKMSNKSRSATNITAVKNCNNNSLIEPSQ